jgi:hypothetical protein
MARARDSWVTYLCMWGVCAWPAMAGLNVKGGGNAQRAGRTLQQHRATPS